MDADTKRTIAEIERNGYIKPGTTIGSWGAFYIMSNKIEYSWKSYVLSLAGELDEIIFKAINDESALQYVYDTFVEGTKFELFERVCEYRKINEN